MATSRSGPLAVASVAVVGLLLVGTIAAASTGVGAQSTRPETDNTVTRIQVLDNGTARWTIRIRTRLDSDARVDEYAAFQSRFRNDTARYLDPFRDRMRALVSNAANATGREMRATRFDASTRVQEVPRRWGIVTYEFTWTNFAARRDGRLAVGDVFRGGFFIAANDTLRIEAPDDHEIIRADPAPDDRADRAVTWVGRVDFADERPRVAFASAPARDASTAGQDAGTQSPSPADARTSSGRIGPLLGPGIVLVGVVALAAFALYRLRSGDANGDGPAPESTPSPTERPTQVADAGPGTDAAVMTDEERILALLEADGGRIRQAAIADELDWSASKTSRVVGRMADEGTVEKLRIGRENLIALADDDDGA